MRVGWIGLGKLGLPCAIALADQGHEVYGYDISSYPADVLAGRTSPPVEEGLPELLADGAAPWRSRLAILPSVQEVVQQASLIIVAVQTPHAPAYGGECPVPQDRRDFEYGYLVQACRQVSVAAKALGVRTTLVVHSTVLPGTCHKLIEPLLDPLVSLLYSPSLIAMGTTIADFTDPEMVLIGGSSSHIPPLVELHRSMHSAPIHLCSIESAELTKVAYNTYISQKITFANALMELCHKTGADVDEVTDGLALGHRRIISAAYLRGGMGDGGACHPRDNIALSWLAERLDLSTNPFETVTRDREAQSKWLAGLAVRWSEQTGLPIFLMGESYKAESPLTYGSPARLLDKHVSELGKTAGIWDPVVAKHAQPRLRSILERSRPSIPAVFVLSTQHRELVEFEYPKDSVVIDPWGLVQDQDGVLVVRVGRKS